MLGVCNLGENRFLDDLLNDERNGNHDNWLDIGKGHEDNLWRWHSREVIDMASVHEFKEKFKGHAIHVGQRQHRNDRVTAFHLVAQHFASEEQV